MTEQTLPEETMFLQALEIEDAAERAAFLERVCGENERLRSGVEALLRASKKSGDLLDVSERPGDNISSSTILEPTPAEKSGTQIGPYKLLQKIGEGGMGVVYMAEQEQPVRRKVALKVIKPGMDSGQVIARFEAERQALAMMDHVNIARVLDAGTIGFSTDDFRFAIEGKQSDPSAIENQKSKIKNVGRPYFVMELVNGVSITKYCDDNRLTPRQRLELFVPVCHAIQHAHQKGIIHRDIKPSNVMVTLYDGKPVPKVIDFGVAKATEQKLTERTLFTQYGTMIGTLEYMSPEHAEMSPGAPGGIDTRSDIYSLGVLLYELLTGSTPLSRQQMKEAAFGEILRLIKEEEPPKPSTRLSDSGEALASISAMRHTEPGKLSMLMRDELDWIVMKTLEKDRNRRYETANGLAADVLRYLNDETVQACPPSAGYRFLKFARRNKRILATVAVVAFALVAGTAVSTWQAIRATEAEGLAQTRLQAETQAQQATREQLLLTRIAEERATRQLFDARLAHAKAGFLSRRVGQRFDSLNALEKATRIALDLKLPAESFLELRNAAIACLALPDLRLAKQWPGYPEGIAPVDFDGKLEQYARVGAQGTVSIRRVADDEEVGRLPPIGAQTWPLFSRDGKFLAVGSLSHLTLWKLGGHQPVRVEHLDDAYGIDFSLDSRQCAIGRVDGPIRLYDLASGLPPRDLPRGTRGAQLSFHPEGRQLAVSCGASVEIRDLETGTVVDLPNPVIADNLAWHPDGKTLAVVGNDRRIYLWDVPAGKQTLVLEGIRNGGIEIAFNHSGDLLASTGWDGILRLWDPLTGHQLFSATWPGLGGPPRFSLDDRLLAGSVPDGKLGLWEIAAGGEYRTLVRAAAAGTGLYHNATIRFDGRLLAVGMLDGVGLWDLTSGRELPFLQLPGMNLALFEPSGALLTNGPASLLRWPVQAEPATPPLLRIGPPLKLSLPGSQNVLACSRDGSVIASPQLFQGGLVLHLDRPERPVRLTDHEDVRYIAVSPDGRWVATGSHGASAQVKVWEAQSGNLDKELSVEPGATVGFSPNGKWLVTGDRGCRLWAVETWRAGPHIDGVARTAFAFSPDSKLLAMETGFGVVRLLDPDTGREYARLEDPHLDRSGSLSFTPDGAQLITTNTDNASIHVWDLRPIREQLAKLGLDWDLPAYRPARVYDAKDLRVEVDVGELGALIRAHDHSQQGLGYVKSSQWDMAIEAYAMAIELDPKNAVGHNNLAWLLATCPDAKFRDSAQAIELTKKAMELAPNEGFYSNTLGVAQYRAGDWQAAVAALEKSNELLGGKELSFNAFFLAMAHWQLGNKDEARNWYDLAVEWTEKNKPQDEELKRFRAEAAELLDVK